MDNVQIIVRPENSLFEDDGLYWYMEKLRDVIDMVVDLAERKNVNSPLMEVILEASSDDTEKCIHDYVVKDMDEIRSVIIFQCSKCKMLCNAKVIHQ